VATLHARTPAVRVPAGCELRHWVPYSTRYLVIVSHVLQITLQPEQCYSATEDMAHSAEMMCADTWLFLLLLPPPIFLSSFHVPENNMKNTQHFSICGFSVIFRSYCRLAFLASAYLPLRSIHSCASGPGWVLPFPGPRPFFCPSHCRIPATTLSSCYSS